MSTAFLISLAADTVFGQKIHGSGRTFQILNGFPPLITRALLGLDVVLSVNEQTDLLAATGQANLLGWRMEGAVG